jgi:hypothetical protein
MTISALLLLGAADLLEALAVPQQTRPPARVGDFSKTAAHVKPARTTVIALCNTSLTFFCHMSTSLSKGLLSSQAHARFVVGPF